MPVHAEETRPALIIAVLVVAAALDREAGSAARVEEVGADVLGVAAWPDRRAERLPAMGVALGDAGVQVPGAGAAPPRSGAAEWRCVRFRRQAQPARAERQHLLHTEQVPLAVVRLRQYVEPVGPPVLTPPLGVHFEAGFRQRPAEPEGEQVVVDQFACEGVVADAAVRPQQQVE